MSKKTHESNGASQDKDASQEDGVVFAVLLAVLLLPVSGGDGQVVHGGVLVVATVVSGTGQSANCK